MNYGERGSLISDTFIFFEVFVTYSQIGSTGRNGILRNFLGYPSNSRAYRVFNNRTRSVMESINIVIDDYHSEVEPDEEIDNQLLFSHNIQDVTDKGKNIVHIEDNTESNESDLEESMNDPVKCSSRI